MVGYLRQTHCGACGRSLADASYSPWLAPSTRHRLHQPCQSTVQLARPTSPRQVVRASAAYFDEQPRFAPQIELELWQKRILEDLYETHQSRKKIPIKSLCKQIQMPRSAVIEYLKWWESLDASMRHSMMETHRAAVAAADARKQHLEKIKKTPKQEPRTFQEIKDIRREKRRGMLSREQEATLESVFAQGTRYPSTRLVNELANMQQLKSAAVVAWFEARRKRGGDIYHWQDNGDDNDTDNVWG